MCPDYGRCPRCGYVEHQTYIVIGTGYSGREISFIAIDEFSKFDEVGLLAIKRAKDSQIAARNRQTVPVRSLVLQRSGAAAYRPRSNC